MARKPTLTVRMGAAEWTITADGTRVDMRKLDKDGQRKVIFECVKFCREAGLVVT